MKRLLVSLAVIGSLAAIPVSNVLWGKGHVPANKDQVCHKGEVITVSSNALARHQGHGDCQLPECDFANVFHTGEACSSNNPGGECNLPNPRNEASTPACPAGTF